MSVLEGYEPQKVFQFFEEISQIPRGTYNTKAVSDYCVAFAKARGLAVVQDELNNIIIKKPGTAGYEDSEPVIFQGHLDMVCEKTPDSTHDFTKDPLDLYVEDGEIRARGTTLGADDGIAVAMALAFLDSEDIPHPPLEALFTVDEEVGMDGAMGVDLSILNGHRLINLDSEEEGILTVGCAGGLRATVTIPAQRAQAEGTLVEIKIGGLRGGHSGSQIHEQRGNAHKLMGRVLDAVSTQVPVRLLSLGGGSKDNVIAMENTARLVIAEADVEKVEAAVTEMKGIFENEFAGEEPALSVTFEKGDPYAGEAMTKEMTGRVIAYLMAALDGMMEYSRTMDDLVETSLNLGVLKTTEEGVSFAHMIRSSVESQKQYLRRRIESLAALAGATLTVDSDYPGWQYNPNSELLKVMSDVFEEQYQKKPEVFAIHAGLECGLFMGRRPDLDCVSLGPDMREVHSFNEVLNIASTQRTWEYLKAVLAALK